MTDYTVLPLKDIIDEYVKTGCYLGDFLTALLENNLLRTFAHADSTNVQLIGLYVKYLYNKVPSMCWGSVEKVHAWQAHGGQLCISEDMRGEE